MHSNRELGNSNQGGTCSHLKYVYFGTHSNSYSKMEILMEKRRKEEYSLGEGGRELNWAEEAKQTN